MTRDRKIPSEEEFARAKRMMREESMGLDELCNDARDAFVDRDVIKVVVLPQIDVNFRAYVFFDRDSDLQAALEGAAAKEISSWITQALEARAKKRREAGPIMVAFEFDSGENAQKNMMETTLCAYADWPPRLSLPKTPFAAKPAGTCGASRPARARK